MTRVLAPLMLVAVSVWQTAGEPAVVLPNRPDSVKFAVLGDNGSGDDGQDDIAAQMAAVRGLFPYEFVIIWATTSTDRRRRPI
jgi:hypothetical protein